MRLVNCYRLITFDVLEFKLVSDPGSLQYAILSHRWEEDEEVTYQQLLNNRTALEGKKGYQKILSLCLKALEHGISYAWIDTCCINKESDAELSEAINSMFRWYSLATICFAYLFDFKLKRDESATEDQPFNQRDELSKCQWFTRAWTLQEFISPKVVNFYDRDWSLIGDKETLMVALSNVTNIPGEVLVGRRDFRSLPVAQRMSWASKRECQRIEDKAYSLLGVFDVNMPLLYGEGDRAFERLQKAIIEQTNDHTIFVWQTSVELSSSVLAPRPSCFDTSWRYWTTRAAHRPYSITNNGLFIHMLVQPWLPGIYLGILECEVSPDHFGDKWTPVGMFLRKLRGSNIYQRVILRGHLLGFPPLGTSSPVSREMDLFVDLGEPHVQDELGPIYGFKIRTIRSLPLGENEATSILQNSDVFTMNVMYPSERVAELPPGFAGTVAIISRRARIGGSIGFIALGFDFDFRPICIVGKDYIPHSVSKSNPLDVLRGFNSICWSYSDQFKTGVGFLSWFRLESRAQSPFHGTIHRTWQFRGPGRALCEESESRPSQVHRRLGASYNPPWLVKINMTRRRVSRSCRRRVWVLDLFIKETQETTTERQNCRDAEDSSSGEDTVSSGQ